MSRAPIHDESGGHGLVGIVNARPTLRDGASFARGAEDIVDEVL